MHALMENEINLEVVGYDEEPPEEEIEGWIED